MSGLTVTCAFSSGEHVLFLLLRLRGALAVAALWFRPSSDVDRVVLHKHVFHVVQKNKLSVPQFRFCTQRLATVSLDHKSA